MKWKVVLYITVLAAFLVTHNYISTKYIIPLLPSYQSYQNYINAIVALALGWKLIDIISNHIYRTTKKVTDEPTAQLAKSLTKIAGLLILLTVIVTTFNISAAASLTLGSFTGLVVGMATQSVLKNVAAGIFIIFTQKIKPGEKITIIKDIREENYEEYQNENLTKRWHKISKSTIASGVVKDITIMYTVLETDDGNTIMIPSATLLEATLEKSLKKKRKKK